jgi:hypothetical protein
MKHVAIHLIREVAPGTATCGEEAVCACASGHVYRGTSRARTSARNSTKSLDIRVEGFKVFNHAQFYGPAAVDGEVNDPTSGRVVSAADPRLLQLAAKLYF